MTADQNYLKRILKKGKTFKDIEPLVEDYLIVVKGFYSWPAYVDPTPYITLSKAEEIIRKIDGLNPKMIKNHGICYAWARLEGLNSMSISIKNYMKAVGKNIPGFLAGGSYWFQKYDFAARLSLLAAVKRFLNEALYESSDNKSMADDLVVYHKHIEDVPLWKGITLEEAKAFKKLCQKAMKEIQRYSGLCFAFKYVTRENPNILPNFGNRHMNYLRSIAKRFDGYLQTDYWFKTSDKESRQKVLTTTIWELNDFITKAEKSWEPHTKEHDAISLYKRSLLNLRENIEELATIIDDHLIPKV